MFTEIEREDTLPTCKWSLYLRGQNQIEKKRKRAKICVCLESSWGIYSCYFLGAQFSFFFPCLSLSLSYKHTHTHPYTMNSFSLSFCFFLFFLSTIQERFPIWSASFWVWASRPTVSHICGTVQKSRATQTHLENQTTEKTEFFFQIFLETNQKSAFLWINKTLKLHFCLKVIC